MIVLPFYNYVVMPNVRIMVDVTQHSEVSDNALANVDGSGVSGLLLVLVRHYSECSGVCSVRAFYKIYSPASFPDIFLDALWNWKSLHGAVSHIIL